MPTRLLLIAVAVTLITLTPGRVLAQASYLADPLVMVESGVRIPLRSGLTVSAEIYRPVTPGRYPTLYASGPLPLAGSGDMDIPATAHTGPIAWFVSQGFNYVLVNSRGTGGSEGEFGFLSREEQQDHYEIIEWIAEQEWSDTKVAGVGGNYYGTSQWAMAVQSPPHLACIAPVNGVTRPYQDWAFPGGVTNEKFFYEWYERSIRLANARANPDIATVIDFDMDLQKLLHPQFDEFWRSRTLDLQLDYIETPVFIINNWHQGWPSTAGSLEAHQHLNNSSKLLLLPGSPELPPLLDMEFLSAELLPFYNWCLQENSDSRYIEKPAVRYAVAGIADFRNDNAWPPGNLLAAELYFTADMLSTSPEGSGINLNLTGNQPMVFATSALDSGFEIAGSAELIFTISGTYPPGTELVMQTELRQLNAPMLGKRSGMPDYLLPGAMPEHSTEAETQLVSRGKLLVNLQSRNQGSRQLLLRMNPVAHRFDQNQRLEVSVALELKTPAGYRENTGLMPLSGMNGNLRLIRLSLPASRSINLAIENTPEQSFADRNNRLMPQTSATRLPAISLDELLDN